MLKFTANGTGTAKGFHFVYQGETIFFFICSAQLRVENDGLKQPVLEQ